jgi:hypothetical protein
MAKRKQKASTASELLYYRYFDRVQVSLMKLPQIDKDINAAITQSNGDVSVLDTAMKALVEKYRV